MHPLIQEYLDKSLPVKLYHQLEDCAAEELNGVLDTTVVQKLCDALMSKSESYWNLIHQLGVDFIKRVENNERAHGIHFEVFEILRMRDLSKFESEDYSVLKDFEDWRSRYLDYFFIQQTLEKLVTDYPQCIPILEEFGKNS